MVNSFEKVYRRVMRQLFRFHLRGRRTFYTEGEWERKRRRECKHYKMIPLHLLLVEPVDTCYSLARELLFQQLEDLLEGLDFSPREKEALLLRFQGYTLREIGARLGMSHRGVGRILRRCHQKLGPSLSKAEARLKPERSGHYGWQEVYLQSLRRR